MASRQNANLQQTYEDFKPLVEEKDTPDALLMLVHLPGFTREQVGANYEAAYNKVSVFGEKPVDNNKRKRFRVEYIIPETCDGNRLKGKFDEGAIITITMPKKPISIIAPKEPKPTQEAPKSVTPPASTSEVEAEGATKKGEKSQVQPKSEVESKRESDETKDETPTPTKATAETTMPQKDEEIPQKDTKKEEKHRDEMKETEDTSIPEKAKGEYRMPQKDQEGLPQKDTLDDEKHEENKRAEKERIQKEDNNKTSEAGKAPQKVQSLAREENTKERKESAMVAAECSGLKTPEKREKEMDVKTSEVDQRNNGTIASESSIGKGIKNMANSASQAVTRLANRFSEEDKQKLLYAGAAILVVAVSIYASFKLRSMARQ